MNREPLIKNDLSKDRAVMFMSASSISDSVMLYEMGFYDQLISYHYIKKSQTRFLGMAQQLKDKNGIFMVDSGGHTYIAMYYEDYDNLPDEMFEEDFWIPLIESYCAFLIENKDLIFCAANFDMEVYMGNDIIDKWNKKYFKPLEKYMDIVYVAHENEDEGDKTGMKRLKQYFKEHDYIGISGVKIFKDQYKRIFQLQQLHNKRVHGFGWTSIPMLKEAPFFSCDSTTWLGGVRYGTSYIYDGKNFKVMDHKHKYYRKGDKILCERLGINHEGLLKEKRVPINQYNLVGWFGARLEYLRSANIKLKNKPVKTYIK